MAMPFRSSFGVYGTVALLATACLSVSANAGPVPPPLVETLTIPTLTTTTMGQEFTLTTSFSQFNPSQGTLNSIDVTLSGSVVFTVANIGPSGDYLDISLCPPGTGDCGPQQLASQTFPDENVGGNTLDLTFSASSLDPNDPNLSFFQGTGTTDLRLVFDIGIGSDTLSSANGFSGSVTYNYSPNATAVPLPATLPLFASGLGALGLLGWRRKRKRAA